MVGSFICPPEPRVGSLRGRYCDRFAPSGKKRTSCGEDIAQLRRLAIAFEGSEGLGWSIIYRISHGSGVPRAGAVALTGSQARRPLGFKNMNPCVIEVNTMKSRRERILSSLAVDPALVGAW